MTDIDPHSNLDSLEAPPEVQRQVLISRAGASALELVEGVHPHPSPDGHTVLRVGDLFGIVAKYADTDLVYIPPTPDPAKAEPMSPHLTDESEQFEVTPKPLIFARGRVAFDNNQGRVLVDHLDIDLTPQEFSALYYLACRAGKVMSPETIYRNVWGEYLGESDDRNIRTHIARCRLKLGKNSGISVVTRPRRGYMLVDDTKIGAGETEDATVFIDRQGRKKTRRVDLPISISDEGYARLDARSIIALAGDLKDGDSVLIKLPQIVRSASSGMGKPAEKEMLSFVNGSLVIDTARCDIILNGKRESIPHQQYRLLKYLADRKGNIIGLGELHKEIWGYQDPIRRSEQNRVRQAIKPLRAHLKDLHGVIVTKINHGYMFDEEALCVE